LPRILSQRLASGLGAGNLPWIKESRTAFREIVRKAWSVSNSFSGDLLGVSSSPVCRTMTLRQP
jgi:hypothetical protein